MMKRAKIDSSRTPSACSSSSHPPSSEVKRSRCETLNNDVVNGSSGSTGTRTTSRYTLEEALECQVCLDVAVSPIYSCNEGGHILCYICHGKLAVPIKCPSCSSKGFQVNPALERQAQKLECRIKCANAEAGCKENVFSTEFKMHLNFCYFRDIKCPAIGCNRIPFKFNEYLAHQQIHETEPPLASGVMGRYAVPIAGNHEEFYQAILSFDKSFLLRWDLTDSIFHIWMVIMGDDKEAMQYFAKISLFGNHKLPQNEASCSWTLQVLPYHEDPVTEVEKAKPVFGCITRKIFVAMFDEDGPTYSFPIKAEMIKMK